MANNRETAKEKNIRLEQEAIAKANAAAELKEKEQLRAKAKEAYDNSADNLGHYGSQAILHNLYESGITEVNLFPHFKFVLTPGTRAHKVNVAGEFTPEFEVVTERSPGSKREFRRTTDIPKINDQYQTFWRYSPSDNEADDCIIRRQIKDISFSKRDGRKLRPFMLELGTLMSQHGIQTFVSDFRPTFEQHEDGVTEDILIKEAIRYIKDNCPEEGYRFTLTKSLIGSVYTLNPVLATGSVKEMTDEELNDVGQTTVKEPVFDEFV